MITLADVVVYAHIRKQDHLESVVIDAFRAECEHEDNETILSSIQYGLFAIHVCNYSLSNHFLTLQPHVARKRCRRSVHDKAIHQNWYKNETRKKSFEMNHEDRDSKSLKTIRIEMQKCQTPMGLSSSENEQLWLRRETTELWHKGRRETPLAEKKRIWSGRFLRNSVLSRRRSAHCYKESGQSTGQQQKVNQWYLRPSVVLLCIWLASLISNPGASFDQIAWITAFLRLPVKLAFPLSRCLCVHLNKMHWIDTHLISKYLSIGTCAIHTYR